jgi:CelD/BcsL family acetyltransferase involved in cellulose biosynthesis
MEEAARSRGWTYTCERLQHSPRIVLPGDWESYLAGIDKKQRHEIRRKLRRFEENVPDGRWYVVDSTHDLEVEAEDFMSLMQQDEEKARFLTPAMRMQMHAIMRCAFDAGCLQLSFLEIGGQKAAGYLSFDYLNRIWVYNSGLDTRFSEYSPGWVLLAHLLQWANENGKSEFDFMRGDEDYKYRFGATDRTIVRVRLTKPTE